MIGERKSFGSCQQIPAFSNLNESECAQLAEITRERSFAPGEKIIEQGKSSQHLWIVLKGNCQVIKEMPHDGAVVLADFEPYNLFGEMSFFSPAPHSANVVAKTAVKLLSIARVDYNDLVSEGVVAAYKLAYNIVEDVATRLRRMDEWVSELASRHEAHEVAPDTLPEWRQFRNKVFNGWNL